MLNRVHRHLKPGGVFICDFWHAPAVEASFTPKKSRVFKKGSVSVERSSTTTLNTKRRLCDVHYVCRIKNKNKIVGNVKETHRLRYFDIDELKTKLKASGLTPLASGPFLNIHKPIIRANTWDVSIVSRRES